jgi:hypothetical protein
VSSIENVTTYHELDKVGVIQDFFYSQNSAQNNSNQYQNQNQALIGLKVLYIIQLNYSYIYYIEYSLVLALIQ